mmetsp:Transcript_28258/g.37719  ORF Transcript_28258/g.37719 Transcript_28258/m.37719 type:complete len:98 (-) Transcript_28258:153-446(-)
MKSASAKVSALLAMQSAARGQSGSANKSQRGNSVSGQSNAPSNQYKRAELAGNSFAANQAAAASASAQGKPVGSASPAKVIDLKNAKTKSSQQQLTE